MFEEMVKRFTAWRRGDFETQIEYGNSKPDRTSRLNVTVKPRMCQARLLNAVFLSLVYLSVRFLRSVQVVRQNQVQ